MRRLPFALALAFIPALTACPDEELIVPPGGVRGRVCNPVTGRPAGGAVVKATFTISDGSEQSKEVTADADGLYELLGIPAGAQTLEIEKAEEFKNSLPVTIVTAQTQELEDPACRDLAPEPGRGTLVGQICNRHVGEVLKDAQIFIEYADGTTNEGVDRTDPETGSFTISDVPTGTTVITVIGVSFQKTYVVEVVDGEIITVEQSADCGGAPLLTTGFITGNLCDPNTAGLPLADALVTASWQDGDGDSVEEVATFTDANGHFELLSLDPDDNITVRAIKDSFAFTWRVRAGENGGPLRDRTTMPDGLNLTAGIECQQLLPDDGRRYLVIEGIYDRIEDALERNGISPDIDTPAVTEDWANNLFSNQERVSDYDAIFINCGAVDGELAVPGGLSTGARNGLRRYIEQGGRLYVADWSYEFVEQVFPEKIDFFGSDTVFDGAQQAVGGTYSTRVLDDDLESALGRSEFDISFTFQAGSIISDVADGVTVYLETDMQYRHDGVVDVLPNTPVTVGFDVGLGRVIFTSFHQEVNPDVTCEGDGDCGEGGSCGDNGRCVGGVAEVLQGPEDEVLQFLIFSL